MSDHIQDQADGYGRPLPTVAEIHGYWERVAEERRIDLTDHTGTVLPAYVNHGRWVANCPNCNGGIFGPPAHGSHDQTGACLDCGWVYTLDYPVQAQAIERLLLLRPKPDNRNWLPGETVADLARENRVYLAQTIEIEAAQRRRLAQELG